MEHAIAIHVPVAREDSSPSATDDPLDLQGLWPITTDFMAAARRLASSISSIADSVSQDLEAEACDLRQTLLEIRARLIYLFSEFGVGVITITSQLIPLTATTIAAHLRNDPHADSPADLAHMLTTILDCCTSSNQLLLDASLAWDACYVSLEHYRSRLRNTKSASVSSLLRSFGITTQATASNQQPIAADTVGQDILWISRSIDRIEAFWRKRQSVYTGSGYTFEREQMLRFQRSCSGLGTAYLHFVDHLSDIHFDLAKVQPSIDVYPSALDEETRDRLSWRALLR